MREEGDLDDHGGARAEEDELGKKLIRAVDLPDNAEETAKEDIAPAGKYLRE